MPAAPKKAAAAGKATQPPPDPGEPPSPLVLSDDPDRLNRIEATLEQFITA